MAQTTAPVLARGTFRRPAARGGPGAHPGATLCVPGRRPALLASRRHDGTRSARAGEPSPGRLGQAPSAHTESSPQSLRLSGRSGPTTLHGLAQQPAAGGSTPVPNTDYKAQILRATTLKGIVDLLPDSEEELHRWSTSTLTAAFHRLAKFGASNMPFQAWVRRRDDKTVSDNDDCPGTDLNRRSPYGPRGAHAFPSPAAEFSRVELLAAEVQSRVWAGRCSGQGLSNLCWAHGKIALGGPSFMAAISGALADLLDSEANAYPKRALREVEICQVMWGASRACINHSPAPHVHQGQAKGSRVSGDKASSRSASGVAPVGSKSVLEAAYADILSTRSGHDPALDGSILHPEVALKLAEEAAFGLQRSRFRPHQVSSLAWCASNLSRCYGPNIEKVLLGAIAGVLPSIAYSLDLRQITTVAWSLSKATGVGRQQIHESLALLLPHIFSQLEVSLELECGAADPCQTNAADGFKASLPCGREASQLALAYSASGYRGHDLYHSLCIHMGKLVRASARHEDIPGGANVRRRRRPGGRRSRSSVPTLRSISSVATSCASVQCVNIDFLRSSAVHVANLLRCHSVNKLDFTALALYVEALGSLRYHDPAVLAVVWAKLQELPPEVNPSHVCKILYGTSHVGHRLPKRLLGPVLRYIEEHVHQMNEEAVACAFWTLVNERTGAVSLLAKLRQRSVELEDFSSRDLCLMYEAELALQLEQKASAVIDTDLVVSQGLDDPSRPTRVLGLLESLGVRKSQARRCWLAKQANAEPDAYLKALKLSVQNCLKTLDFDPVGDYHLSDIPLDLALPDMKIALVVDSPQRFTVNSKVPTGSSLLRRRLIRAQGWHVVVVNIYKWETFTTRAKKVYLQRAISEATAREAQREAAQGLAATHVPKSEAGDGKGSKKGAGESGPNESKASEEVLQAQQIRLQRAKAMGLVGKGNQRGSGKWANIVKATTTTTRPNDG
mmetsp:Transcript_3619/g.12977  ORF Transcript_3619/g.12977 Transcript_3619/m.12977 type:complete len:959 (+) Transcript_3619:159-3035(+)